MASTKLTGDDDQSNTTVLDVNVIQQQQQQHQQQHSQLHTTDIQEVHEGKTSLTPLTTCQTIKLPSSECELINLKKIIPASTTIATHQPHHLTTSNLIQQHMKSDQQHQVIAQQQQQPQQQQHHHHHQQQPQHHHQHQQQTTTAQVQNIVPTINIMGLRNVHITEQPKTTTTTPLMSRIKYSRGKIITTQGESSGNIQIIEAHHVGDTSQDHELPEGGKYEISEIDINNSSGPAAIFGDLVKYSEIDDIELPDGTKISVGYATGGVPQHQLQTTTTTTQLANVEHVDLQQEQHQQQTIQQHNVQIQQQYHQDIQTHQLQDDTATVLTQEDLHLKHEDHDDATTSVDETILPDNITLHERSMTKSYTILTTRPIKQDPGLSSSSCGGGSALGIGGDSNTATYELSLSDSSLQPDDTKYVCRHCGKKYRWKSTLRRHENVECGGKEPCHPCPHCSYKAKQRGNLGVHVRKHHPDKPQLESKRGRKM